MGGMVRGTGESCCVRCYKRLELFAKLATSYKPKANLTKQKRHSLQAAGRVCIEADGFRAMRSNTG
jgi:hypothetical protein